MFIGKVTGYVVSTQKETAMADSRLVVVEAHSAAAPGGSELQPTGRFVAAVDSLSSGLGDYVLVTQGSSSRMTAKTREMPVDAVVIGIIDSVRLGERVLSRADGSLS